MEGTDTSPKAAQMHVLYLCSAKKQENAEKTWEESEKDWATETQGHNFRTPTPSPSRQTHSKIRKGYRTLITQMRTGKIGLRHFLLSRKVPNINDPRRKCRINDQTVRHPTGMPVIPQTSKINLGGRGEE